MELIIKRLVWDDWNTEHIARHNVTRREVHQALSHPYLVLEGKKGRLRIVGKTDADHPNAIWLTDITYIDTNDGFLYVAGVLDLYSRQIVGLAMTDHLRSELTETALNMALIQRQPDTDLLHHSDRGSQYTCSTYQQMLTERSIIVSMSRTGNCLDNAPMESFWATLKRECADHIFASIQQARTEIFAYIMTFYNRVRRHSALDYLSPHDYEMLFLRQTCTLSN